MSGPSHRGERPGQPRRGRGRRSRPASEDREVKCEHFHGTEARSESEGRDVICGRASRRSQPIKLLSLTFLVFVSFYVFMTNHNSTWAWQRLEHCGVGPMAVVGSGPELLWFPPGRVCAPIFWPMASRSCQRDKVLATRARKPGIESRRVGSSRQSRRSCDGVCEVVQEAWSGASA